MNEELQRLASALSKSYNPAHGWNSGLVTRIMNAIRDEELTTLDAIRARTETQWLRVPNMGRISVKFLMSVLREMSTTPLAEVQQSTLPVETASTEILVSELQRRGYAVQLTRQLNGHAQ